MKKLSFLTMVLVAMFAFSSCGVNSAFINTENQNSTQVHLSNNNFKVVEKISGSADVDYILFFGGMNKKRLYENAYADMINKANLMASSRALINIVTEEHVGGVPPFYYTRTITVSAHVVEFTE